MAIRELRRLLRDDRGAVALVVAVSLPVAVGGMGLGTEVGYWYFSQRKVQNAADLGAYAGAVGLRSGASASGISSAALAAAEETGFLADRGQIDVSSPPAAGSFVGDANAVEVTVQESLPRMLTSLFAEGPVQVSGRAVARITEGQQTCVLALDPTASRAVEFIGSSSAILIGCNVHSNSLADDSVVVTGAATVETPCMSASGNVSVDEGLTLTACVAPYEQAEPAPDPYADLQVPDLTGAEKSGNLGGGAGTVHNITPGRYRGMDIRRTVNMAPGVYVVDGGELKINATASVNGEGVTFYLTNGATLSINGSADVHLSAPTSGTYSGVLMFVGRNEPSGNIYSLNGDSDSAFNGAIYVPNGKVRMNGSTTFDGGCTQIVARQVELSGNAGIGIDCTGAGIRDIRTSRLVRIVE